MTKPNPKPFTPKHPEAHLFINSQVDVANAAEVQEKKFRDNRGFNINLFDIPEMDDVINPAKPEDYIAICANPGNWKTAYLNNLLRRDSEKLEPTGKYFNAKFSWEETLPEFAVTELSNRMSIPVDKFVRGDVTDLDAIKRATAQMRKIPTYFFGLSHKTNDTHKRMTIEMVEDSVGILMHELGLFPRLVCPDYVQAATEDTDNESQFRHRISSISKHFKFIAKQFGCAVVAASQANFEVPKREWKVPKQDDHWECKSIAQDIDKHIGFWFPIKTESNGSMLESDSGDNVIVSPNLLIVGLDKQRFGFPTGTWYVNVDSSRNEILGIMRNTRNN